MVNELTIAKGIYTVTLYATTIAENFSNKIFIITPAQSAENQTSGPQDSIVVDLLRVTHQIVIKCYIAGTDTKTAKEVKEDLIEIFKGGATTGGVATLTYDSDSILGFIEKINLVEKSEDSPSDAIRDNARYEVALTFIEGVAV